MSAPRPATDYLVRTSELGPSDERHVSYPLNERSQVLMTWLSDRAGLSHLGISIARVPPGKESFALHAHTVQEEWIFVLSGEARVRVDDDELLVGPGDFLGFPANGPAHLIRNTSDADFVFLQGGDRRPGDRVRFPDLGLVCFEHDDEHMALVPEREISIRPFTDWFPAEGR